MAHLPERIVFCVDLSDEGAQGGPSETWQANLASIKESILGNFSCFSCAVSVVNA